MATYVFVAGAWHGSWCWSQVVPLLKAAGHRVLTPDLLGMTAGEDPVTDEPVRKWADQIADLVAAQEDPVILVGHSRAGIVISEVAERIPARVELLVYLAAYLLKHGEMLSDIGQRASNREAFSQGVMYNDDGTCSVLPEKVAELFYNDTPAPLVQVARDRLVREPVASFMTPAHLTAQNFGSVPRAYIECTDDQAVPIADQRIMQQEIGVAISRRLDSDHSPFFSQSSELVAALEDVRQRTTSAPAT